MYINTLSFNAGIRAVLPDFSLDSGLRGDLTKVCFAALHQTAALCKSKCLASLLIVAFICIQNDITMILLFFCKVKDFL